MPLALLLLLLLVEALLLLLDILQHMRRWHDGLVWVVGGGADLGGLRLVSVGLPC
jgi:hypothetical protein